MADLVVRLQLETFIRLLGNYANLRDLRLSHENHGLIAVYVLGLDPPSSKNVRTVTIKRKKMPGHDGDIGHDHAPGRASIVASTFIPGRENVPPGQTFRGYSDYAELHCLHEALAA